MGISKGKNNPPQPPSANPAIQLVNVPTPYEARNTAKFVKYTDWENSPGPHDILQAPGMNDMLDIYGSADSLAAQDRLGNPGRALSAGGSGDYAAQLNELTRQNRYDQRAEGLSHGLQATKSEAYGLGASAADLESNRKNSYASLMSNQENQYYNRPKPRPLWERIAGLAIGGANAAAGLGL